MSALSTWAGTHVFAAPRVHRPTSVAEVQQVVASSSRVRALGSRHSFTDLADTDGDLLRTDGLPVEVDVDSRAATVRVSAGTTYGELATRVHEAGWALGAMASLPHIGVAGAVATGTHGSGDAAGSLSSTVRVIEYADARGDLCTATRGEPDFEGRVVALGALGVVTQLVLDVEPAYSMVQEVWTDLGWDAVDSHLDDVLAAAESVSLFTRWDDAGAYQVWLKRRADGAPGPGSLHGARHAVVSRHMLPGGDTTAVTDQGQVPGPWHERLPHFRLGFTPSAGAEIQSEYLVPRRRAAEAVAAMRPLGAGLEPVLLAAEIRSVAADDLWLSPAHDEPVLALHFTWRRDLPAVRRVLAEVEAALLPLEARPHWGKLFLAGPAELERAYPRLPDFRELVARDDPDGVFGNAFLTRHLGL